MSCKGEKLIDAVRGLSREYLYWHIYATTVLKGLTEFLLRLAAHRALLWVHCNAGPGLESTHHLAKSIPAILIWLCLGLLRPSKNYDTISLLFRHLYLLRFNMSFYTPTYYIWLWVRIFLFHYIILLIIADTAILEEYWYITRIS